MSYLYYIENYNISMIVSNISNMKFSHSDEIWRFDIIRSEYSIHELESMIEKISNRNNEFFNHINKLHNLLNKLNISYHLEQLDIIHIQDHQIVKINETIETVTIDEKKINDLVEMILRYNDVIYFFDLMLGVIQ